MKRLLLSLGLGMMALCGVMMPVSRVSAASDICSDNDVDVELRKAAGCKIFEDTTKTAVPIALNIINVVLSFVGVIAVGVIVYGGVLYITSMGDASKITKAKNCILYGVVGLVVAIMAFAIVAFVNTSVLKK